MPDNAAAHKTNNGTSHFWSGLTIFICLSFAGIGLTYWASSPAQKGHLKQVFTKLLAGQLAWDSVLAFFNARNLPDATDIQISRIPIERTEKTVNEENKALIAKLAAASHDMPAEHSISTCKRKPAALIQKQKIYQWKDAQGRTHFSDEAPLNGNSSAVKTKNLDSGERFTLNLDSRHATLPAFATDRIKRDVNTVYRVLVSDWEIKHVQPIQLNLKLFDSKSVFDRYKSKVAPRLGNAGGFYIGRLREASVLTYRNKDHMYAVTRHEATHAINHHAFGLMPTWLNEGLAEYFEALDFQYGSHATNTPSKGHLRLLKQQALPSLPDYLQLDGRAWYAEEQKSLHYAVAWSLVYFFLSSDEGEVFFKSMLNHLSAHYCEGLNTLAFVNQHYAGGVNQLAVDWKIFLRQKMPTHYY